MKWVQKNSSISNALSDQVWWCNMVSELFQKLHLQISASKFMTSYIIPLPFVLLNLESVERKGKNYKKLNISRMKSAFSMKWKTFFIVFEELSFGGKINIWQKIADTSFKHCFSQKHVCIREKQKLYQKHCMRDWTNL